MRIRAVTATLTLLGLLALGPSAPLAWTASAGHEGSLVVGYLENLTAVDGILAAGEYADAFSDASTGISIHVQYSGSVMGIALESPGRGWVALSLGAVLVGSNYTDVLVFALANGTLVAVDRVDHGWEQHFDVAGGGTDDIIAASGAEGPGGILVEFQIPLDSADDNDHHFRPNETYPFSLAFNATSADLEAPHTAHSDGLFLVIGPAPLVVTAERPALRANIPTLTAGFRSMISAVLGNASGGPIPDQPIEFYQYTTFGLLYLGLDRTNAVGKAGIEYEPRTPGTWTFLAAFRGTGRYLPVNATVEVTVAALPAPGGPILPTHVGIGLVVAAVLGGVWGSYAFVFAQLGSIRRSARRSPHAPISQKGEGGDTHRRIE